MRQKRMQSNTPKLKGKEFYLKMKKAKELKKEVLKKDKIKKQDEFKEPPQQQGDNFAAIPKKELTHIVEVTAPVVTPTVSPMELNHDTHAALERALARIGQQARGL